MTTQPVEPHTAQVNVYLAPSAPAATCGREGAGVAINWQDAQTNTSYKVWRSAQPYFTPGQGDSITIASWGMDEPLPLNCAMDSDQITCTDAGVLATPGRYFYVVQGLNSAGAAAPSARLGAYVFTLSPGN